MGTHKSCRADVSLCAEGNVAKYVELFDKLNDSGADIAGSKFDGRHDRRSRAIYKVLEGHPLRSAL